jgi:hypothetical protein
LAGLFCGGISRFELAVKVSFSDSFRPLGNDLFDCHTVVESGFDDGGGVLCVCHGVAIMSAMRTDASSIFRIADFSLWLRVAVMTFAEQLSGFTASDLIAAFPGIPRSTAYDWLSGVREPVAYLQPVALAHLQRAVRTPNKSRQRNPMGGGVSGKK